MKNITHYFTDLSKNILSVSASNNEVKEEPAKNGETLPDLRQEPTIKKKYNRVKSKISREFDRELVCNILDCSSDSTDKTPSPHSNKRSLNLRDNTSKRKPPEGINSDLQLTKKMKRVVSENRTHSNGLGSKIDNDAEIFTDQINNSSAEKIDTFNEKNSVAQKKNKQKKTDKLVELANKRGYSKRKIAEEEEAAEVERRLEKRMKLFTESTKNSQQPSGENIQEISDPIDKKHTNLLNYFCKATPEQLEKERLMKAKIVVKAEIHKSENSLIHIAPLLDKKKKKSITKKIKVDSKQLPEEVDEICLIQSETLILSPKNEKLTSPLQQNQPKWSLKIQLSNDDLNTSDFENEDLYTPSKTSNLQNKNIKNNKKIPKALLPIKNRKSDLSKFVPGSHLKKNRGNGKNIGENEERELKTVENKFEHKRHIHHDLNKACNDNGVYIDNEKRDVSSSDRKSTLDEYQKNEENTTKNKPDEKLAPLFKKKTSSDLQMMEARNLFLHSNATERSNENDTQKLLPVEVISFPIINHVDQLSDSDNIPYKTCNFSWKNDIKFNPLIHTLNIGNLLNSNDDQKTENYFDCENSDIKTTLLEMELCSADVKSLWSYISPISKSENLKRTPKRRKTSERKKLKQENNDLSNELLQSPWTEKYKPQNSKEIVGNEEAVLELKTWLNGWKLLKKDQEYSSSEEFYNSDNSNLNIAGNNQVAVLVGPHGCGKTASVYAVAQELGYRVLEVNASSKRPGKKILKDFEEATRSHRVKNLNLMDAFIPIKKVKEQNKISQNSLILLEDVDLVFEEDEGFISAVYQLASNTKRPIVMTLQNTYSHLSKMAPQQLQINFQSVENKKVSILLQLIALAETGCKLSENCTDTMSRSGDIRRSILQLQYILMSGEKRISLTSMAVKNSLCNDIRTYIYKPAIKIEKKKKKSATHDLDVLDKLANSLDRFILISNLIEIEDSISPVLSIKSEPSLSLEENFSSYSSMDSIRLEIGNYLNDTVKKGVPSSSRRSKNDTDTYYHQLLIEKKINNSVDAALSQIPSNVLDHQALAVDYLPIVRTICRAEEARNLINSKRGNRFFHYLQGSRLSSGALKSGNILSTACKMLQKKTIHINET